MPRRDGARTLALVALAVAAALHSFAATPVWAQASPSAFTSATRYDARGRVTGTIAPDPDGAGPRTYMAVRNTYSPAGDLIAVEQGELAAWQSETVAPASWPGFTIYRRVETEYDAAGHKIRERTRDGPLGPYRLMTEYRYDLAGRLECTAVRMNPALFDTPPSDACLPRTPGEGINDFGPDRITRTVYDAAGQRRQVWVGQGGELAADATWAYNQTGQPTVVIDANGNRAELHYDGHGRQDRWTFPHPTVTAANYNPSTPESALASAGSLNPADFESYGYDPNGNRTSLRKRDGLVLTYEFDALNRMTVKHVPERLTGSQALTAAQTRDVFYGYDLRGLQIRARFDSLDGDGITTAYDGFGRIASSTIAMGVTSRTLAYQYDPNGNRTRVTHPGGTFFGYGYDEMNRLTIIRENGVDWLSGWSYTGLGPPTGRSSDGGDAGSTLYGYDGIGRLTIANNLVAGTVDDFTFTYAYNPAGQIDNQTRNNDLYAWTGHHQATYNYASNGLNQYSSISTVGNPAVLQPIYDPNGNMISDGGLYSFKYDVENRLVSGSGGIVLAYDPLGRLFQISGGAAPNRQFLYDGDELVAEYDGITGALTDRYVHAAGADDPQVWYSGASRRYLRTDHQGSVIAVTDAAGVVLGRNTYDPWGIPGGTGVAGRFRYTGQMWIPELGIYHYKARMYSPSRGRFLQVDPVGYDDQFNLYAYVGNDPVNHVDPTGEALDIIADIGFIAYDIYDISQNGFNRTNVTSLGANIVGAVVPFATGLGPLTRGGAAVSRGRRGGEAVHQTSRAARRDAMRQAGVPTSRPAQTRSGPPGRRQLEVQGHDGRPRIVTQHPPDTRHPNPHWHAGNPRRNPTTGQVTRNQHGQAKYENEGVAQYREAMRRRRDESD